MTGSRGQAAQATPLAGFWGTALAAVPADDATTPAAGTPAPGTRPPTLLRPITYRCANCAGRFPARTRPTPYCSLTCGAEAKAVRYARKQRAEHGDNLPQPVRILLQRKIMHALTECAYDKWSGQPEPDAVTPPAEHPLASHLDPEIPPVDTFAVKHQELRARALAPDVLLPCDADDWDAAWRTWVNLQAR
jgi:hypothetical protein